MITQLQRYFRILAAVAAVVVCGFLSACERAHGAATSEVLAKAPVFQLLLDNSGSSPATDPNFMRSAWPLVEGRIRAMPLGTVVIVNTVGDASLPPLTLRTRLQKRADAEGAAVEEVVQSIRAVVLGFPKRVLAGAHGQSHLVGGVFDASKNINRSASGPNVIVMLSDLIEYSPLANCYKVKACPLPKPTFQLENTEVLALGVGRNLASDREMAVFSAWEKFLDQTGATYSLKKTF